MMRYPKITVKETKLERDEKPFMERVVCWFEKQHRKPRNERGSWQYWVLIALSFAVLTLAFFALLSCAAVPAEYNGNSMPERFQQWLPKLEPVGWSPIVLPYNPFDERDPVKLAKLVADTIEYKSDYVNGVPFDVWQEPHDTFAKKTGDCEDKALLLMSALQAEGYVAYLVTGRMILGDKYTNHAITGVEIGGVEYFVDPTERTPKFYSERIYDPPFEFAISARVFYLDGKAFSLRTPAMRGAK